jgi:hypothetical protein
MYKIVQNDRVVDVVRIPRFVSFLTSGHIAITGKTSAQGIVGSDNRTIYSFKPVSRGDVGACTIKEITPEEFSRLQNLLNSGQEISADESALATAKREAIKRLSNICKNRITSGFSVILSDGETYNFKLTTEDQLNLMSIEGQLNAGAETFIYHATNQPCRFFSREDMIKIINTFKRHTLYHTTYFNTAKQYINSLVSIEKVNMFTYGTDVSDIVEDPVIKQILKNGGNLE